MMAHLQGVCQLLILIQDYISFIHSFDVFLFFFQPLLIRFTHAIQCEHFSSRERERGRKREGGCLLINFDVRHKMPVPIGFPSGQPFMKKIISSLS